MGEGALTPFFIPVRDRLGCLQELLKWLINAGHDPRQVYLVDMDSSYPPLLCAFEGLEKGGYNVIRTARNGGAWSLFKADIVKSKIGSDQRFFVSDPDVVPDKTCDFDILDKLHNWMTKYIQFGKIGLGLRIDDLPDCFPHKQSNIQVESRYWTKPFNDDLFLAPVATTFCLFRSVEDCPDGDAKAARTAPPNLARHLPWYLDPENLPEDERYYYDNVPHRVRPKMPGASWKL